MKHAWMALALACHAGVACAVGPGWICFGNEPSWSLRFRDASHATLAFPDRQRDHRMACGRTQWEELVFSYRRGVARVRGMQATWEGLQGKVDAERYEQVRAFLAIQETEARWWRDACVLYFQTFSGKPIPAGYDRPEHDLATYRAIRKRYVPGH